MKPTLTVTSDFTEQFQKVIQRFKKDAVLVGIPEDENARNKSGPIGNAALLAINNFGSPANNIPPRPVMQIGIRKAQKEITEAYKQAAVRALSGGLAELGRAYQRVGIIASVSIKKVINEQDGIDPPSAATLRAREAQGFEGTSALIVTGAMRNAITYAVKES